MSVAFRNVDAQVTDSVESWPYEALVTAIERGGVREWARIAASIARDPWGPVAASVEDYLNYSQPYGVGPLLQRGVKRSRANAQQRERATVAEEVRALMSRSGLSRQEFADRIGTSRSRLSTYERGSVAPSSTMLVRMRELVERLGTSAHA